MLDNFRRRDNPLSRSPDPYSQLQGALAPRSAESTKPEASKPETSRPETSKPEAPKADAREHSRPSRSGEEAVSKLIVGKVGIDVAEIRGRFEGELTARKQLVVRATGRVSGKIRYGRVAIEEGGELSGDGAVLRPSAPGNDPRWKGGAELGDLPGPRPPRELALPVLDAVLERRAQRPQPERLAENVGVDRDVAHERVPFALLDHLVELVDQHVAELAGAGLAVHDRG